MSQDEYAATFINEALELLEELESSLLALEATPDDRDLVDRVFRSMHTIKGSGAMFGFDELALFTHNLETVFDRVRQGELHAERELVTTTLKARDVMLSLLQGVPCDREREAVLSALGQWLPVSGEVNVALSAPAMKASPQNRKGFCVTFTPNPAIFLSGTNPQQLVTEVCSLGSAVKAAHTARVPLLRDLDPETCYLSWSVCLSGDCHENDIRDVFIFVEDESDVTVDAIGRSLSDTELEEAAEALDAGEELRTFCQKLTTRVSKEIVSTKTAAPTQAGTLRVPAEKLDCIVNLVGELVTLQARLGRVSSNYQDDSLAQLAEDLDRLTAELRDNTLNIRMMPIGNTFERFRRLVRDLSQDLGKDIDLVTTGAETELDKTMLEKLADPLVHIIRNSIDHGIESSATRVAAGKPARGTLRLDAVHVGDSVQITVSDDGAGFAPDRILKKALERGLVRADANLSEQEVLNLVFAPGFSTADTVTSVSGRGVGMDVVKRAVEALRGEVTLQSTTGAGSTVTIRLPLTLAIVESLLVQVGAELYAIPLYQVAECVELPNSPSLAKNQIEVRGKLIPFLPLREFTGVTGDRPEIEQVVLVQSGEIDQVGLLVDKVIGEHQAVIKSLGPAYRSLSWLAGATILGDGAMALILDIAGLVRYQLDKEQ